MIQTDELKSVLKKKKRSAAEASLPEKEKKRNKKRKKAKELEGKCDYYIHMETSNVSFLKMYKVLKSLGVENNKFHLALYDKTLRYVDPYSPDLTIEQKTRIIIECKRNLWYYIREVARIVTPGSGIAPGKGKRYMLKIGAHILVIIYDNHFNCLGG